MMTTSSLTRSVMTGCSSGSTASPTPGRLNTTKPNKTHRIGRDSGLSYEEAAKVCNCAVGTIKSRASRAREELTRLLSEDMLIRRAEFAPIARDELLQSGRNLQSNQQRFSEGAAFRRSLAVA